MSVVSASSLTRDTMFVSSESEVASLIQSFNWVKTPLGKLENWPSVLKSICQVILDSPLPMAIMWGKEYTQLYNDAYRQLIGEKLHACSFGESAIDSYAEYFNQLSPLFEQVFTGKPVTLSNFHLNTGNNEKRFFDYCYSPIKDQSNNVAGILVNITETTDKLKSLEQLKENEQQLKFAVDAAELATWDLDPKTNRFRGNDRLKQWFGLKPDDEIDLTRATASISEHDRERVLKAISDALSFWSGGDYDIIYSITHPFTKKQRVVRAKGKVTFAADKTPDRFTGILQDITQDHLSKIAIKEKEERLSLAIKGADLGTFDYNLVTGELYWSRRTKEMFGLPPEAEVDYNVFLKGIHPDDREQQAKLTEAATDRKLGGFFEREYRTIGITDGKLRWIRSKGKVIFDDNGKAIRFNGITQDITAAKLAQQELVESENRFRFIAERLPQMIWMRDPDNNPEYTSKKFEEYSGIKDSKTAWAEMVHPEDWNNVMTAWEEHYEKKQPFRYEVRLRNKAGSYRWHYSIAEPIKDNEGKLLHWIGVVTDIHEQKTFSETLSVQVAERTKELEEKNIELVRSKAFLKQVLDASVEYISVIDKQKRFVIVNKRHDGICDLSQDEFIGKHLYELHPHLKNSDGDVAIEKALQGELVYLAKRPTIYYPDMYIDTYYIPWIVNGQVEGAIIMARDITNIMLTEKRLEQQNHDLKATRHFLQTVLDSSVEIVLALDKNLRFTFVNKKYEQFTGRSSNDVTGKYITDIHKGMESTTLYQEFRDVFAGKPVIKNIRESYSRKGIWLESYTLPLKHGDEIVGVVTLQRDITQIMKLSEDLKIVNKELQRSNEDLMQFAHVASHDLKEPLRKIRVFADLLKSEMMVQNPSNKALHLLNKIDRSSTRMNDMIEGVLAYSAAESDNQMNEDVDMNAVMRNIQQDLEVLIQTKHAVINVADLPVIKGSSVLIQQLFLNLLNNALKFSKKDGIPQVNISFQKNSPYVTIIVEDNGIGFNNDNASSIFRTFKRLHPKDAYEGTGLGLALCKKIAERHGGSMSAVGEEGVGARFYVNFPAES